MRALSRMGRGPERSWRVGLAREPRGPAAPLEAALAAATLAVVAHLAFAPMGEHDLFFHLKLGDLILAHHAIPFRNLFSFTFPEHPDPDLAWGFQVAVALLHGWHGFPAIVLAKTAAVLGAAALVQRACRRAGAGPLATAAALVVAALAAQPRMVERPHLATFVGLGALQLLLVEIERGRRRLVWALPPLALVWANLHAGVFLAPATIALFAVGARLDGALDPRARRQLALAALAACAAALCTPAGLRLLPYLLWHTGVGSSRVIDEFRAADAWDDPWFFVLSCGAALTLLGLGRRVPWRRALPVLAIAPLALRSVRFVAEWALLAAPLLAAGLTELGRHLDGGPARPRRGALAAAAALLVAGVWEARRGQPLRLGLDPDVVPFDAIAFVTRAGLRDRLYADLDVGCYLLWEGWPRFRVFQDARLPAYPDDFHRALDRTPLEPRAFDALLRRFGVDAALLDAADVNMRAGSFDPEEWALVLRDDRALVFARRTAPHHGVIAEHEIPLRLDFRFRGGTRATALPAPPRRSPVAPCEWSRRLGTALDGEGDPAGALDARARALAGGCLAPAAAAEVHYRLGARLQRAGRRHDAIAAYDRALALDPAHAAALANRGFARLDADPPAARRDLSRALALDPSRADVRFGLRRLASRRR